MIDLTLFLLFLVFPTLVVLAGVGDMMTMKISNRFSLALIVGFVAIAPLAIGPDLEVLAYHVGAGLIMLTAGFTMFALGWIGGGDAKLAACIALWLGFPALVPFAIYAALFGGALTLSLLAFRVIPVPLFAMRVDWLDRLLTLRDGIPYGLALAAAALVVYPQTIWLSLVG